jgi:hypothetical protein
MLGRCHGALNQEPGAGELAPAAGESALFFGGGGAGCYEKVALVLRHQRK